MSGRGIPDPEAAAGCEPAAGGDPVPQGARRGFMLVLSAPSAAGKSTLVRRLVDEDGAITFSVSVTTRLPRPGEEAGRDLHFVDHARFREMIERDELLEHATVFGNGYGTPRAPVESALRAGRDVVSDIDCQGAAQLRASLGGDVVLVYVLPPSAAELKRRLAARGGGTQEDRERRIRDAVGELARWEVFDYVIVNDDVDDSLAALKSIVAAERHRRVRLTSLAEFVTVMRQELSGS